MISSPYQNKNGQLLQQDFPDNTGGTNLVDSVFKIQPNQAAGGYNFDYVLTGGIRKRLGNPLINSTPDTNLETLGFGLYAPVSGTSKSVFRAAGTRFQLFNTTTPSFTALSQDTALASTTPFAASTSQNVQFVQFSTGTSDILWGAGGGATLPVGAYSTTKFTANGSSAPSGSFIATNHVSGSGHWSTGNYGQFYWAFTWVKKSTGAESNAAQDVTVTTTSSLTDTVSFTLTPPSDTTLYQYVNVYRSALDGTGANIAGFTTGNLIAQLPASATSFVDFGDLGNPDILLSTTVPRAANIILDNSTLPSGTYNTLALWGHRLCTSSGNSLYISDVNKSESWPLTNYITVPSGGPITALATISYTSPQANSLFELLVIFKERELWVLSPGATSDYTTWSLLKIDSVVGCPQQSLVVNAQGFLSWIDYRGIWLWDGTSKPIYCSRPLEPLFGTNGDLDKTQFANGCGAFFRRENQIVWYLSSKTYGTQKFAIKMDMRLTMLQIEQNLTGRTIDAILIQDVHTFPVYASMSYIPLNGQNEQLVLGDNAGYCYFGSNSYADGANSNYGFRYLTAPLNCGDPNTNKQFEKVVVWVQDIGTWNLYLDYWSNFRTDTASMSTQGVPLSTEAQTAAVWDIALYDTSYWDSYAPNVVPIVFNLQAGTANSAQGGAIQLQFRNDNANQPIVIHGFSVIYGVLGGIT
jgi:hypothetical protein